MYAVVIVLDPDDNRRHDLDVPKRPNDPPDPVDIPD